MEWKIGLTLGSKEKEFKWRYSRYDGLTIIRTFKNGNSKTDFSNTDIEKILNYVKEKERVPLANNVEKLVNGTEGMDLEVLYTKIFLKIQLMHKQRAN